MNFVIHFLAPFRGHPRNGVIALEQRPAARVLSGGAHCLASAVEGEINYTPVSFVHFGVVCFNVGSSNSRARST